VVSALGHQSDPKLDTRLVTHGTIRGQLQAGVAAARVPLPVCWRGIPEPARAFTPSFGRDPDRCANHQAQHRRPSGAVRPRQATGRAVQAPSRIELARRISGTANYI